MVKTERMPARAQKRGKHPHVRSEDANRIRYPGSPRETPPRAWGRRIAGSCLYYPSRNTPTCVGKTITGYSAGFRKRKHPHVRGEDGESNTSALYISETPPRAWGRQDTDSGVIYGHRNTPTCVGKTVQSAWNWRPSGKHPHVRGEDTSATP